MKKLITLVAVLSLVFVAPVFAQSGGEGSNTGCNGQGNENSPCEGSNNGGRGGDGGSVKSKIINKIKNTNRNRNSNRNSNTNRNNNKANANANANNKNSNSQEQSANANNEGVNVDASDNSSYSYEEVPQVAPTFPLNGTTSVTISTPFGGGGFSKDAPHAKLMALGSFIQQTRDAKLLSDEDAKEATLNVINKLLRKVCGRSCVLDKEESVEEVDKAVTGNGGNL